MAPHAGCESNDSKEAELAQIELILDCLEYAQVYPMGDKARGRVCGENIADFLIGRSVRAMRRLRVARNTVNF